MLDKLFNYIKIFIKEEYKFIIILLLLFVLFNYPVNYYIITGGGISDISSRVKVTDKNKSKGSFNISYVEELEGTLFTYGLSYLIPSWERDSTDNYKYNKEEKLSDIEFRNELDLDSANGNATYWAYTLANKNITRTSSKIYVILVDDDKYKNKLKVQDEILSIDNKSYDNIEDYKNYIQTKKVGDYVDIYVKRKNIKKHVKCSIYSSQNRKIIGVGLQVVNKYKTKPPVKIKFKSSESGPSGGLITTLEIYNQLTKKDLTHGRVIAGTGTIESNGKIGEIGGVKYKLLGATKGGAEYFLVPSGSNYKEAIKYKKEKKLDIKIIEVKDIKSTIKKLEELK